MPEGQARRRVRPATPEAGRCTDGPNRTERKELAFFGPAFPQAQSRDPVLRSVVRRLREQGRSEVFQCRRTVFLQQNLFQFISGVGEPPIQFQRALKLPPSPCGGASVARSPERLNQRVSAQVAQMEVVGDEATPLRSVLRAPSASPP